MALVLTPEPGEFIFIGPAITIAVIKKKGTNRIALAIVAPRDIVIGTSKQQRKKELAK